MSDSDNVRFVSADGKPLDFEDFSLDELAALGEMLDTRDMRNMRKAEREIITNFLENGIRTVERCQLIKSKAGRQYRQKPEHGRGKGKRTKQWELGR